MIKHLEVAEAIYHRWRNQFCGMKADDVKRLKELEVAALKEIAKGRKKVKLALGSSVPLRLVASR